MSEHLCHAKGCSVPVPPKLLFCAKHWRMVPKDTQREVWKHYVPGQEIRKDPTRTYLQVMRRAIDEVAALEAQQQAASAPAQLSLFARGPR